MNRTVSPDPAAATPPSSSAAAGARNNARPSGAKGWMWLPAAGAAFLAVALWPVGEGLAPEGQRALALLAGILVLWISEALPLAVTAILTVLGLLATQPGLPPAQVLAGFASSAVFFLLGVLGLGAAVAESGLASAWPTTGSGPWRAIPGASTGARCWPCPSCPWCCLRPSPATRSSSPCIGTCSGAG